MEGGSGVKGVWSLDASGMWLLETRALWPAHLGVSGPAAGPCFLAS